MTVQTQTSFFAYVGDGVTTVFPFPSKFMKNADLVVALNGVVQTSGYTVTGAKLVAGGSVTITPAPAAAVAVAILRNPTPDQLTNFINSQTLLGPSVEDALDRITGVTQYLTRALSKVLRIAPDYDSTTAAQIPLAAGRANKYLAFDATGQPIVTTSPVVQSYNPATAAPGDINFNGFGGVNARDAVADSELATRGQKYIATGGTAARSIADRSAEFFQVKDYDAGGTLGSADDTSVFQAAANALSAAGGGVLMLPRGTFFVTQVNVPSNTIVRGHGNATIIKQKALSPSFSCVFDCTGKSNVAFYDFQIDGNGNAQVSSEHNAGINISDSTDISIHDLIIHDCQGDAIQIVSSTPAVLTRRISVVNNTIYNLGRHGISVALYGGRNVFILGNKTRRGAQVTTSTSQGNGIHLELDFAPLNYTGDIIISQNTCEARGITVGGEFRSLIISNNLLLNCSSVADFGHIALISAYDATISGNVIEGDGVTVLDGIYIQDAGGFAGTTPKTKNITVAGNTIVNVAGNGVHVLATVVGSFSCSTTNASPTLTNVTNINGIAVGKTITGAGIPALTTIVSVSGSAFPYSVTMSNAATATAIGVVVTQAGPTALGKFNIYGNTIDLVAGGAGTGIKVESSVPKLSVSNNVLSGGDIPVSIRNNSDFSVTGNNIAEFSQIFAVYIDTNNNRGLISGNTITHSNPTGKWGIRIENDATNQNIGLTGNNLAAFGALGLPYAIGAAAVNCYTSENIVGVGPLNGQFAMTAAVNLVITNANIAAGSKVYLTPTNAAAATLMGSIKALYISAKTANASFTVATANGAAAAGTETFDYRISS